MYIFDDFFRSAHILTSDNRGTYSNVYVENDNRAQYSIRQLVYLFNTPIFSEGQCPCLTSTTI